MATSLLVHLQTKGIVAQDVYREGVISVLHRVLFRMALDRIELCAVTLCAVSCTERIATRVWPEFGTNDSDANN